MTTCLKLSVIYFLSYLRMGSTTNDDDAAKSMRTTCCEAKTRGYHPDQYCLPEVNSSKSSHCPHPNSPRIPSNPSSNASKRASPFLQRGHPPPPNLCRRQYCFRPSKMVWSSGGLYCSIQEDLNLHEWQFFESCKRIWEKAGGAGGGVTEEKCSRRHKTVVKNGRLKIFHAEISGASRRNYKSLRDMATSPTNLISLPYHHYHPHQTTYEEPISDLSMSLEPISSSSFHSSSDCDGDVYS